MNTEFFMRLTADNIAPQKVDEPDENTMYVGYCLSNCKGETDDKWLIKRIREVDHVKTISWADGEMQYNKRWRDRATYNYRPTPAWTKEDE